MTETSTPQDPLTVALYTAWYQNERYRRRWVMSQDTLDAVQRRYSRPQPPDDDPPPELLTTPAMLLGDPIEVREGTRGIVMEITVWGWGMP